jgi:hypothetical protein
VQFPPPHQVRAKPLSPSDRRILGDLGRRRLRRLLLSQRRACNRRSRRCRPLHRRSHRCHRGGRTRLFRHRCHRCHRRRFRTSSGSGSQHRIRHTTAAKARPTEASRTLHGCRSIQGILQLLRSGKLRLLRIMRGSTSWLLMDGGRKSQRGPLSMEAENDVVGAVAFTSHTTLHSTRRRARVRMS